jgi:hypothetical protein
LAGKLKVTLDDHEFLRQFEDCSLPFKEWTHRAHIKVAYLYLRQNDYETALAKMRRGIQAYNAVHKVPECDTSGYNETTTCAMMQLVAVTITAYEPIMATPSADAFCDGHPQLLTKHILRLFYSPQRRMQPRAKREFIEPDMAPLPVARNGA